MDCFALRRGGRRAMAGPSELPPRRASSRPASLNSALSWVTRCGLVPMRLSRRARSSRRGFVCRGWGWSISA